MWRGLGHATFFNSKIFIMYNALDKKKDFADALNSIDLIAIKNGTTPANVAIETINGNLDKYRQFVIEHGERPETSPEALAAQVVLLHESKIWDKIENAGIPDYTAAEEQVFAEEEQSEFEGNISNFNGSLLGAAYKAGVAALGKINQKRVAKGKKPILEGEKGKKLLQKIESHIQYEKVLQANEPPKKSNGNFANTTIGAAAMAAAESIEKDKTTEAIKKYLPYAIIVLILVFLIGKKSA